MATHGTEYNEVGTVSLALDHLNPSGYPNTFHGHQFGRWKPRTGWAVHAWRVRPEDKFAVVPVKAEKAKVRPKAAFAKRGGVKRPEHPATDRADARAYVKKALDNQAWKVP